MAAFLFYKAAVWAACKGLVSGNKLNPSRDEKEYDDYELKCDTYEFVWFKGESGYPYMIQIMPASLDFSDVSSTATYTQAVSWAVKQGITAGTGDTTFSPNNTCTRGEIVTFLHRAMG